MIKQTKGTLRKDGVNPQEPRPKGFLSDPPAQLTDGAKEAWRLAIASTPEGLLTGLDANILVAWAVAQPQGRSSSASSTTCQRVPNEP